MNNLPKISDAEWEVMKVLWKKSPLTSTEIIEALKDNSTWSPKTIHTLISRLVNKGALAVEKGASINEYRPLVEEEECRKEENRSFLKRVYDGSLKMLLSNFINNETLSEEEIEELKRMLDHNKSAEE